MIELVREDLLETYNAGLMPPFTGGMKQWAEENISLPAAYAIPGPLDFSLSPYLIKPMEAIDDPHICQVNLAAATQTAKSLLEEIFIPYSIINNPKPILRVFHNDQISGVFAETRLIPLLQNIEVMKPLIAHHRHSVSKSRILLPHTYVLFKGANEGLAHGVTIGYLLCDELHQWETGYFDKFKARTSAFAGRRKIICASQPGETTSEWEQISYQGRVYEWQWLCPCCKTRQPFHWTKEKAGNKGYAGFNWDKILNPDGSTNIELSSKTTWLECVNCDHRIHDTVTERRLLNDTGDYVCIKLDGDPETVTYTWPNFVNVNLSFASAASQYMAAKKFRKQTGLDEQLRIFVTQVLGKFYKRDEEIDISKVLTEAYDKDTTNKDWLTTMGVDVQRTGKVKYYVVRSWKRNGNESKRIEFGIARTWEEIEAIRAKHNIPYPLVHVDSGDGETVLEVYQECLKHGKVVNVASLKQYTSWTPTKGDGNKSSYKHPDNITRLYSTVSNQDAQFTSSSKWYGIPAPLILFSNYSVKTILANLRDNLVEGVKWLIDSPDAEYDKQINSEGLFDVVDDKSGLTTKRFLNKGNDNHYWDCEVLNLVAAMRANVFSSTKVNEDELRKIAEASKLKQAA